MKEIAPCSAVLLFHPGAQEPRFPRFEPDLPVHDPLLSPFGLLRQNSRLDELTEVAAEDLMLFGK